MLRKNTIYSFILLILFLIPSCIGLLHSGFPATDDGSWMIIRFSAFYQALRHGQFPVRFLIPLNHGYGYPVADFLYPLFMYIGVPIHLVGFGFINTIKIILGCSLLFSGIFCFFWLRKLFTTAAAFIGAVAYVLFPYHVYDIYQRGSVGEVLALAIIPFIFWQIERRSLTLVSLGIALLILSHNILALLFLPIIVIYLCIKPHPNLLLKGEGIKRILIEIILSLCLSAFFWLPALYDKQFTIFDKTQVSDFSQYFIGAANFGLVGLFVLLVSIISVVSLNKKRSKEMLFFLFITLIGLFFSISLSAFFWKLLPLPKFVQFPFRFLSIVIPGIAFLSAYLMHQIKGKLQIFAAFFCLCLFYVSTWSYLFPKTYLDYPDSYYATNQDTTTVQNEYMPKWVKQIPLSQSKSLVELINGNGSISNLVQNNSNKIQFTVHVSKQSVLRINQIYFPGWKIFVNNNPHEFSYTNNNGVMDVELQPGDYSILAKFGETPVRLFGDAISLVSLILLIILILKTGKRQFVKA
jgi:hypothetical protein